LRFLQQRMRTARCFALAIELLLAGKHMPYTL
jgi:hypothetical protein